MEHPEWRESGDSGRARLMIPDLRNTKAGYRIRWVLFK